MGDVADMMLDGILDAYTGEYIDGDAPGYPRTINGSLPWENKHKRNNKYTSNNPAFGITKYLASKQFKYGKQFRLTVKEVLQLFHAEMLSGEYNKLEVIDYITNNFGKFVSWLSHNHKKIYFNRR